MNQNMHIIYQDTPIWLTSANFEIEFFCFNFKEAKQHTLVLFLVSPIIQIVVSLTGMINHV